MNLFARFGMVCWLALVAACGEVSAPAQQGSSGPSSTPLSPSNNPTSSVGSAADAEKLATIWQSKAACESYFKSRPVKDPMPRLATWNLRWFPDGTPEASAKGGVDLEWLSCVMASLELDVIAVQEVKRTPLAKQALAQLVGHLSRLSGVSYAAELDACGLDDDAHVGFIYNKERVTADTWQDYPSLNPYGVSCQGRLRTGFGGYFKFANGPDLSLISVHLKSGSDERSYTLRRQSLAGLKTALERAYAPNPDDDRVVLGDFNSMGCSDCVPAVSQAAELQMLSQELLAMGAQARDLPTDLQCSQYYMGKPGLLDHVVVAGPFSEFAPEARVRVSGYCGVAKCAGVSTLPPAYVGLSDHCPLVFELGAEDQD